MQKQVQLNLSLPAEIRYELDDFIVSDCNAESYHAVRSDLWYNNRLMIIGPPGSGKTHLCNIWARADGAEFVDESFDFASDNNLILKNLELFEEEFVFHLINHCQNNQCNLLITNPSMPEVMLPDLRSRLNATSVVSIQKPDDALLKMILIKHFNDLQLDVPLNVIEYAMKFLCRNFQAMREFANGINQFSLSKGCGVSIPVVKQYLNMHEQNNR